MNSLTKPDSFPLPRIEDCVDQVGPATFIGKFALLKGYWQVPLTAHAQETSSFITPFGAPKRVLYYALVLLGMGKTLLLPVNELISNQRSILTSNKSSPDLKIMKTTIKINEPQSIPEATETTDTVTTVCGRSSFTSVFTAVLTGPRASNK